jgi:hypothetical protein
MLDANFEHQASGADLAHLKIALSAIEWHPAAARGSHQS